MILAPLLLGQSLNFDSYFDRAVSLNRAAKSVGAVITITSTGKQGTEKRKLYLDVVRPDRGRITFIPETVGSDAPHRIYTAIGPTGYGYEKETNCWLQRTLVSKEGINGRLQEIAGRLDDPALMLLDPSSMDRFISLLRAGGGFQKSMSGGNTVLRRGPISVRFDATGRIVGIDTQAGGNSVSSRIDYKTPPKTVTFVAPSGATKVEFFREGTRLPRFKDEATRALLNKTIARYWAVKSMEYHVASATGTFDVSYQGGKVRQSNGKVTWTYDGKTLTMLSHPLREVLTGSKSHEGVLKSLQVTGVAIENFVRNFWLGRNPVAEMAKEDMTARSIGSVTINGVKTQVLELKAPGIQIQFQIRPDGLLSSVTSHNLNRQGAVMSTVQQVFTYKTIEKPIPAATFQMKPPAGYKVSGL